MANLPTRNNNPGNLRDTSTGQFRVFATPQEGFSALLNDLQAKMSGRTRTGLNGDSTLADFANKYAPKGDGANNPASYAANIANSLKVRPDTKLSELQSRIGEFAEAVAKHEGWQGEFSNTKSNTTTGAPQKDANGYTTTAQLPPPGAPGAPQSTQGILGNVKNGVSPALSQALKDTKHNVGEATVGVGKGFLKLADDVSWGGQGVLKGLTGGLINKLSGQKPQTARLPEKAIKGTSDTQKGAALATEIGAPFVFAAPEATATVLKSVVKGGGLIGKLIRTIEAGGVGAAAYKYLLDRK